MISLVACPKPHAKSSLFERLILLFIVSVLSFLCLSGCLSKGEKADLPEPAVISEFAANSCPSCLPEPKLKPSIQISNNHPRLTGWPSHLLPISNAVVRALYTNTRDNHFAAARVPSDRFKQTEEYADVIFWRKPLHGKEYLSIKNLRTFNPNMSETKIAKDALVFFTHKDNPVSNLSLNDVKKIYSGNITNWMAVGGQNAPIIPYQRQNKFGNSFYSLSQEIMHYEVMAGLDMIPAAMQHVSNISGYSSMEVVEYKNDPTALGYCVRWTLEMYTPKKMLKQIKILSIDNVYPSEDNIREGLYPLAFEIFALTPKLKVSRETETVIDWLTSHEGKEYLKQVGYVPY